MWGDPERAASLRGNDPLATLLFQIGSPAHIPWGDPRWQEVLHGYDVWVHMDADSNPLVGQACQSMAKHAEMSSNLAALSLHVTRMLRELVHDIRIETTKTSAAPPTITKTTAQAGTDQSPSKVADFSRRISRVAKARATAGALQLLRLLCHPVIVKASQDPETSVNTLREAFIYHTRGDLPSDQPAGFPLMHSILDLVAAAGTDHSVLHTPEVYDAMVFAMQLLFVLCGTQLYQPFQSSFENNSPFHYILREMFRLDEEETIDNDNLRSLWTSSKSFMSVGGHNASSPSRNMGDGDRINGRRGKRRMWTSRSVLETCLEWQVHRPEAPERSIARFYYVLAQSAVTAKGGERPGPDGMYESYMVVQATAPILTAAGSDGTSGTSSSSSAITTGQPDGLRRYSPNEQHNIILDVTRGVLTLSGNIILLPFRLMSLVFGVFAAKKGSHDAHEMAMMKRFNFGPFGSTSRTRDVLWLSDSLLADLGCSLILLLANNNRNEATNNPFRSQLKGLTDNRWEQEDGGGALPDLPDLTGFDKNESFKIEDCFNDERSIQNQRHRPSLPGSSPVGENLLTLNFESLFVAFGRSVHTELGALFLYTLIQSSPCFAESLVVRSDLDTLVMPLLRTLYFASRSHTYMAKDYASKPSTLASPTSRDTSSRPFFDIRSCPFRSQSQLYVIIILLLLFSQDSSFGRDAFRRISVPHVVWYKERHLKSINLGSIMILTLLRSLLFNLNRLHDPFLLSNCCAVLMNMSPSAVGIHEYAAMRLAAVTVTVMKKHYKLATVAASGSSKQPNGESNNNTSNQEHAEVNSNDVDDTGDDSSPLAMHSEVSHTLLGVIKQCLSPQNVEQNWHLIYALVYHQVDLMKLCKATTTSSSGGKKLLYSSKLTERIQGVTLRASELIQEEGARSAPKALKVLETQMSKIREAAVTADNHVFNRSPSKRKHKQNNGTIDRNNTIDGATLVLPSEEEFTFTYEEESDPEIFFLPYVWEVIVCVVTSGSMDWKKDEIRAFALLDEVDDNDDERALSSATDGIESMGLSLTTSGSGGYTKDADELV